MEFYLRFKHFYSSEWIIIIDSLSWITNSHVIHISHVIITYTLKSLSSLTIFIQKRHLELLSVKSRPPCPGLSEVWHMPLKILLNIGLVNSLPSYGIKSLPRPMLAYCQLDPKGQTFVKFLIKYVNFYLWKCCLKNFSHFVQVSMCSRVKDQSGYGLGQWEEALHSNASSHWPSPYPERSLRSHTHKTHAYGYAHTHTHTHR